MGHQYMGEYTRASHEWRRGLDKYKTDRKVVVFNLIPVGLELSFNDPTEDAEENAPGISIAEARKLALAAAEPGSAGGKGSALRIVYYRSRQIADYVLRRANGQCESCNKPAPFLKKNGAPYLEPHHVNRLSDGGLDHPRYIGAICPACHREIHHGLDGKAKNEMLKLYVEKLEL